MYSIYVYQESGGAKLAFSPPPSLILCYFKGSNIVRDFHQSLVLPFRTRDFYCRELLLSGFCKKKEKNRPIFCLQLTHTNTCTNFLVPVNNTEKRFNSFYLGDNLPITLRLRRYERYCKCTCCLFIKMSAIIYYLAPSCVKNINATLGVCV